MRYTDTKGRKQTLTAEQATYLQEASRREFERGWGGLSSTLTVRLLHERGLIVLNDLLYSPWRVTDITPLGEQVLARWKED